MIKIYHECGVKTAHRVHVIHEATEGDDVEVGLVADDIGHNLHRAHHHPESEDLEGNGDMNFIFS